MKIKSKKRGPSYRHEPAPIGNNNNDGLNDGMAAAAAAAAADGSEDSPFIAQMLSDDSNQRELGCSAAAMALCAGVGLQAMLNKGVHGILISLLTDESHGVRAEAAGALRNMSLGGDETICKALIEKNILNIISNLLAELGPRAAEAVAARQQGGHGSRQIEGENVVSTIENLLLLLWELSEKEVSTVAHVNQNGLIKQLCTFIDPVNLPVSITVPAAQCLQTLTDDNAMAVHFFLSDQELTEKMVEIAAHDFEEAGEVHLRVVVIGCLFNIGLSSDAKICPVILQGLCHTLEIECNDNIAAFTPHIHEIDLNQAKEGEKEDSKLLRKNIQEVSSILSAQKNALEILANICSGDDDSWEDVGDENDDDDDNEEYDEAAIEIEGDVEANSESAAIAPEILEMINSLNVPEKVLARCSQLDKGIQQLLAANEAGASILAETVGVQSRALACLGNILLLVDISVLDPNFVSGLWISLFSLGMDPPVSAGPDFVASVLGAMWSILRKAVGHPELQAIVNVTAEQVSQICAAANADDQHVRTNAVGMIGCIGQCAAYHDQRPEIAASLVNVLQNDKSMWVIAEALNCVFDLFAEPEVNEIVVNVGMMDVLQKMVPQIKAGLKEARRSRKDMDLVGRLDEAKLNLVRFIRYKQPQFA